MSQEQFRMVINETFLIRGRGTAVTGIIESGTVKIRDKVTLLSAENEVLITSVVSGIEMPNPENLTEAFLNSKNVGILIYSEKFYAMAKKGMYLVSASANPKTQ